MLPWPRTLSGNTHFFTFRLTFSPSVSCSVSCSELLTAGVGPCDGMKDLVSATRSVYWRRKQSDWRSRASGTAIRLPLSRHGGRCRLQPSARGSGLYHETWRHLQSILFANPRYLPPFFPTLGQVTRIPDTLPFPYGCRHGPQVKKNYGGFLQ